MEKRFVKLIITNNVNDNRHVEWAVFESEEKEEAWISEKENECYNWNYMTSGAVSTRYYSFESYTLDEVSCIEMNEFEGMTFGEFVKLIKHF